MMEFKFDQYQFQKKPHAVAQGTGISFDDYERMGMWTPSKLFTNREITPPSWAVNHSQLREVLVRYFELRARIFVRRSGSAAERLDFAEKKVKATLPALFESLDKSCRAYMEAKQSGASETCLRKLESHIRKHDSEILMVMRGPAIIVGIIQRYHLCGHNAKEVASELGMTHEAVRQIVHRLKVIAEQVQNGTDSKPKAKPNRGSVLNPLTPEEQRRNEWHRNYTRVWREKKRNG
jgi:hypothetical protein